MIIEKLYRELTNAEQKHIALTREIGEQQNAMRKTEKDIELALVDIKRLYFEIQRIKNERQSPNS